MIQQCSKQIISNLLIVLANSGRFFNRMGRYQMCMRDQNINNNMLYRWVFINDPTLKDLSPIFNLGLCLPISCSDLQIKDAIDQIFENTKQNYRVLNINSNFPIQHQSFSLMFYLIASIICLLSLIVIATSIMACSFNRSKYSRIQNHQQKHKMTDKIISIFSIQSSMKIFKSYRPSSNLNIFNGIKTFAMFWVILSHQYFFNLQVVVNSLTFFSSLLHPYYLFIQAGMLSVDIFLFLGGFFVASMIVKDKNFTLLKIPYIIFNRLLRFWPSYIVSLLIFCGVLEYLGSGPYWFFINYQTMPCSHWWRSIFFLDNLIDNGKQICMSWGWYLQVDVQLFVFSLFLLYLYKKHRKVTILTIVLLMVTSLVYTMYLNYSHDFKQIIHLQDFGSNDTSFNDVYIKPWCRCSVYFYGILYCLFWQSSIQQIKNNQIEEAKKQQFKFKKIIKGMQNNKKFRILTQVCGLLIMIFVITIPRTSQVGYLWDKLQNSLYLTFSKILFMIGLSLLIFPSLLGFNSIVNTILNNKFTHIVSKISFMVYLTHLFVILQYSFNKKTESYYSIVPLFNLFVAHATLALIIATYLVFIVQIPFYKIQKAVMERVQKLIKTKDQKQKTQQSLQLNQSKINSQN